MTVGGHFGGGTEQKCGKRRVKKGSKIDPQEKVYFRYINFWSPGKKSIFGRSTFVPEKKSSFQVHQLLVQKKKKSVRESKS
eukprot:NODE_7789_length_385_cov_12.050595_g6091_i0.p1 GENE.NODE_7789_length_385_cov_12.050595_g6091_i0~~NODE_7789_length_385_cov_12.050595_g6091_i0.p1  ORF type:complete len:81 (+),score=2.64 NODE_7789_length_385_cov_12.050595_g6091_i0:129-371(+)